MDALQEKAGMPVEIEACINDSGLYLLQLRGYELPRKHFAGLHQIPESKMFFKTKRESLGFDQFKGDVVMSYDLVDCDPEKIFAYFGNVSKEDLPHLEKYKCLIFPMVSVGGNYEAAHSFGYTSQILVELEKRGVRAIAVAGLEALAQFDESERFQRLNSRTRLLKDVTVECDGTDAQIYFNT